MYPHRIQMLSGLPWRIAQLACLAVLVVSTSCAPVTTDPLRIGINSWPGYELIYLAQEKGFFQQHNVDVKLVEFGSLADARRAYETGKIDGLATTLIEVIMARDMADRDLQVVHVFDFSVGGDVIITGSNIQSVSDLTGKSIGVELASLGIYVLSRALELENMTFANIQPVSKDQKTMRHDLQTGKLHAVVTYPPESVELEKDPRFHVIFSSRDIPGEIVDVLAVDNRKLSENPAQIRGFMNALQDAYSFLQQHQDEACQIMGEREGLEAAVFRKLLTEDMQLVEPSEQADYFGEAGKLRPVLEKAIQSLRNFDLISEKPQVIDCLRGGEGFRHE